MAVRTLAESVKTVRQPVASDNPFLALERLGSDAISASWDLFRDLRDATIESLFFLTYGGLMRLGIPSDAVPESEPVPTEPRELPEVRKSLEAMDHGGFLEAIARIGALMASQRGEFPLSRLEQASELKQSDAVLSKLTVDEALRIKAEQSTLVEMEPERALETLPGLLADSVDREHVIDLMERAVTMVELNADQAAMLDRIRRVMGPTRATTKGNGRARSSPPLPLSSS